MPMRRDPAGAAGQVRATLDGVVRRARIRSAVRAGSWSAGAIAIALAITVPSGSIGVRLVSAGAAAVVASAMTLTRSRRERTRHAAAAALERGYPSLRNLAVTAEELIAEPDRTRPYMWTRVMQAAAQALAGVDAARVVPLTRDMAVLAIAVVAAIALLLAGKPLVATSNVTAANQRQAERALAAGDIVIDITPPVYTARATAHLRNPASIEALAGSVAEIRVAGVANPVVRVNGTSIVPEGDTARGTFAESGFVAIDAGDIHRLMPLTVTPDRAPDVRVTVPGKDLRVADAQATIPIHASAADDIGLRTFELRYTVVSGGGEQFAFREGTLQTAVTKDSGRAWSAAASLSLAALKLEPGDALIYRAVAADARPGSSGEASSDTYFVEIAGPGDVPLEGVDMPPDRERYALSQAMIVLKIQRLIARQAGMPRTDLAEAAAGIAAEQRAVRANFVFLLGGEVEDEVVEAEASHEIQEGRLANQARREIVAATLSMRKVEESLAAVAVRPALPPAQEAVRALQRAFGRSRYLLRALPVRIRLDPSRRLSGDAASARDWSRDLTPAAADRAIAASRRAVAEATAISGTTKSADAGARLEQLAEDVLAISPGAADLQDSARRVMQARDLLAKGDTAQARKAMQDAIAPLLTRAQRGRVDAPPVARDAARLTGAVVNRGGVR